MNYNEFVKKFLGKKTDYDKVCGVQCVDLVKQYLYSVFGIKAGAWGNAKDYWLSFNSHSALTSNFTKIKNTPDFVPKKGDIVVWSGDISNKHDCGHIAIATGEGNTSYFYSYDQNWNSKEIRKVKHSYKAFYGVLRPKNQSKINTTQRVTTTKATVKANGGLRMRSNMGTSAGIVTTIPNGAIVDVINKNCGSRNGYGWAKVKYKSYTGYVASKYLK